MPSQVNSPLPSGYVLDQYRIDHQLSMGGFSFVYLAYDVEGVAVAIKEYLPHALAYRPEGGVEPVVEESNRAAFRYGMKCFFEEGRILATLIHPNVVRVLNFFRANETVYMVMQFERGRTLHQHVQKNVGHINENFIRWVFARMLNGLREVHAHKLLHLDIKPANIYLRHDGTPVLLDFGAARQTLMGEQSALKPMYTPGFAAPEQLLAGQDLGPWTDIYGVGASLYATITGKAPPRSDDRAKNETLVPLVTSHPDTYSEQLRALVDWCLCLDPLKRPQSVYALQKALASHTVGKRESSPPASKDSIAARLRAFMGPR